MAAAKKRPASGTPKRKAAASKAKRPSARADAPAESGPAVLSASRPASKPPSVRPPRTPRTRARPWPRESWLPERHEVAMAHDVLLMAYWIADQLGDPDLSEDRRAAFVGAIQRALPVLRGSSDSLRAFLLAGAVRRNGQLMAESRAAELVRLRPGGVLDALLEAHEDEAVHATIRQVREHSPEVAAWLEELERRGRPELRNALRANPEPNPATSDTDGPASTALRRLLTVVAFATDQFTRRAKPTSADG